MAICMPSAGDLFPHIFNLINSNIGVGLLAMPYCFHEYYSMHSFKAIDDDFDTHYRSFCEQSDKPR
ncbi:hypothetical protein ACTXT7_009355 [Hymenolepis weldensis]